MIDVSIVVPAIRSNNWFEIYNQLKTACKKYSFEVIWCSYKPLPKEFANIHNVKYIKDFGHPSRAFQMGTMLAEGKYLTWLSDDGQVQEDSIDLAIDLLKSKNEEKDIIAMRYTEGVNFTGREQPDDYWTAWYHADLRLPGIKKEWKIPLVSLLKTEYFRYLGGLDCRFEHINFNVHDMGFRAQRNGSNIYMSPKLVMKCDWQPNNSGDHAPINQSHRSDQTLLQNLYSTPEKAQNRPIKIDYMNWTKTMPVWPRRHG